MYIVYCSILTVTLWCEHSDYYPSLHMRKPSLSIVANKGRSQATASIPVSEFHVPCPLFFPGHV